MLRVTDGVADRIGLPYRGQRIGNQIDAPMIFARVRFKVASNA
jgi:hypothetical protein